MSTTMFHTPSPAPLPKPSVLQYHTFKTAPVSPLAVNLTIRPHPSPPNNNTMCRLHRDHSHSFPYAWYWKGKSLQVGENRAETIHRVCTRLQPMTPRQGDCCAHPSRVEQPRPQHQHKGCCSTHPPKEDPKPKCCPKRQEKGGERQPAKVHPHRSSSTHRCKHYSETQTQQVQGRREVRFCEDKAGAENRRPASHSHRHEPSRSTTVQPRAVKRDGSVEDRSSRRHQTPCCHHHKH